MARTHDKAKALGVGEALKALGPLSANIALTYSDGLIHHGKLTRGWIRALDAEVHDEYVALSTALEKEDRTSPKANRCRVILETLFTQLPEVAAGQVRRFDALRGLTRAQSLLRAFRTLQDPSADEDLRDVVWHPHEATIIPNKQSAAMRSYWSVEIPLIAPDALLNTRPEPLTSTGGKEAFDVLVLKAKGFVEVLDRMKSHELTALRSHAASATDHRMQSDGNFERDFFAFSAHYFAETIRVVETLHEHHMRYVARSLAKASFAKYGIRESKLDVQGSEAFWAAGYDMCEVLRGDINGDVEVSSCAIRYLPELMPVLRGPEGQGLSRPFNTD